MRLFESSSINVKLTGIKIFPVKSLHAIELDKVELTPHGLKFDREWMVVSQDKNFVSQRQIPQMASINVELTGEHLVLRASGYSDCLVSLRDSERDVWEVTVQGESVIALNEGTSASEWLTAVLGEYKNQTLHLVRFASDCIRPVDPGRIGIGVANTKFADEYPILVTSEASLNDLNDRLAQRSHHPVDMDRFRPNLTIAGAPPFVEDEKARLRFDRVVLGLAKDCARCVVTTVDQNSGRKGPQPAEPLATLATFRRKEGGVMFGQSTIVLEGSGETIQVGDSASLEGRRNHQSILSKIRSLLRECRSYFEKIFSSFTQG